MMLLSVPTFDQSKLVPPTPTEPLSTNISVVTMMVRDVNSRSNSITQITVIRTAQPFANRMGTPLRAQNIIRNVGAETPLQQLPNGPILLSNSALSLARVIQHRSVVVIPLLLVSSTILPSTLLDVILSRALLPPPPPPPFLPLPP